MSICKFSPFSPYVVRSWIELLPNGYLCKRMHIILLYNHLLTLFYLCFYFTLVVVKTLVNQSWDYLGSDYYPNDSWNFFQELIFRSQSDSWLRDAGFYPQEERCEVSHKVLFLYIVFEPFIFTAKRYFGFFLCHQHKRLYYYIIIKTKFISYLNYTINLSVSN